MLLMKLFFTFPETVLDLLLSGKLFLSLLMQKADFSLHPLGSLLKGCSNMMMTMENAHLTHIFRECNMTADSLAKDSINHKLGLITFENPPIHVAQAYLDDISAVSRARRSSCFSS